MQIAIVARAGQFERFSGQNEPGDHEENMHHGPAGVDDTDERELNQRRGSRFRGVDAVVGGKGDDQIGEMVQHDDDGGDAAQAVQIRCGMDSRRFVDVRCDATGYWVRKERCCESFDEAG